MDHLDVSQLPVEVRRSARRVKTVSATIRDGRVLVLVPARMSAREESETITRLLAQLQRRQRRRRVGPAGDEALADRAAQLSERYLEGHAAPASVRWVTNQHSRWGSCTPSTGTIRLSHVLQGMPDWVVDYVLLHELTHLLEPGHGPAFQRWMRRYPRFERAKGYLEGYSAGARLPGAPDVDDDGEDDAEG